MSNPLKDVTFTNAHAKLLASLHTFLIDKESLCSNYPASAQTKVHTYTVCITETGVVAPKPKRMKNEHYRQEEKNSPDETSTMLLATASGGNEEGDNTVMVALGGAATGFMAVVLIALVAVAIRKTHKSIKNNKKTVNQENKSENGELAETVASASL